MPSDSLAGSVEFLNKDLRFKEFCPTQFGIILMNDDSESTDSIKCKSFWEPRKNKEKI